MGGIADEPWVDKQQRLRLELQCVDAFKRLRRGVLANDDFTLLFYTAGARGFVAFKTTLSLPVLVRTFQLLVQSWRSRMPRAAFGPAAGAYRLSLEGMQEAAAKVQPPPGVLFSLLVGRDDIRATSQRAIVRA